MSAGDPRPGEPDEDELAAWLERLAPARPSPAARAAARRQFLTGEPASGASRPGAETRTGGAMAHATPPQTPLDAGEEGGFAAWLAGRMPLSPPRPEARRRARLSFLSAASNSPAAAPPSRARRVLVWLAAAAALLLVTLHGPEPDRWRVRPDGPLVLDGAEFELGEEDRLAAALEHSGRLESRATRARLVLGGVLEFELLPGTTLEVPPLPELDGLAPLDFELARGEVFLRTRAGYPGNPVRVRTDLAEIQLSGTTVGVLADEEGTCVCVAEGAVRVTSARGVEELPARNSLRLFRDPAQAPRSEPFAPGPASAHVGELLAFHGAH